MSNVNELFASGEVRSGQFVLAICKRSSFFVPSSTSWNASKFYIQSTLLLGFHLLLTSVYCKYTGNWKVYASGLLRKRFQPTIVRDKVSMPQWRPRHVGIKVNIM